MYYSQPPPKKKNQWLKCMKNNLPTFTEETETNILEEGVEERERNN